MKAGLSRNRSTECWVCNKNSVQDQWRGIFLQNKKCSHRNIQHSSYVLSKCLGNLFPGRTSREIKMPNFIISLCGINYGGGSLRDTSTTDISQVLSLLTKIFVPYKNFLKIYCQQLLLQVVILILHLLLQFRMQIYAISIIFKTDFLKTSIETPVEENHVQMIYTFITAGKREMYMYNGCVI